MTWYTFITHLLDKSNRSKPFVNELKSDAFSSLCYVPESSVKKTMVSSAASTLKGYSSQ